MGKTLNELAVELKELIIDLQSDAHNKGNIRRERYNNMKLVMDIAKNPTPHVIICIGMSAAEFSIKTGEKTAGGLGPDERYVLRWIDKTGTLDALRDRWTALEQVRGKATVDKEI